jgi:hypothetical protein
MAVDLEAAAKLGKLLIARAFPMQKERHQRSTEWDSGQTSPLNPRQSSLR